MSVKISTKIAFGSALMTLLLITSGFVGLRGVSSVSDTLRFVTGPAWDAADGAMEGTIGIQEEMIAMERALLGEITHEEAKKGIEEAQAFGGEAIQRMLASGLMSDEEVNAVTAQIAVFRSKIDTLLKHHAVFEKHRLSLTNALIRLDDLMMSMEGEFEKGMDGDALIGLGLSSTRIQALWDTADAMMETRISLLRRNLSLEHILSSHPHSEKFRSDLNIWLNTAEEQIAVLLASTFAANPASTGKPYKELLEMAFTEYKQSFDQTLAGFDDFKGAKQDLGKSSKQLLGTIEQLEESADRKVESVAEGVAGIISFANNTVYLTIVFGILLAGFAFLLSRKTIIRPLNAVAERLHEIGQGEGDLTVTLDDSGSDELADLARGFNSFVAKIRDLIQDVAGSVDQLKGSANNLTSVADQSADRIHQQQSELDQAATAMNEMSATVSEVAKSASNAAHAASDADNEAASGQDVVTQTVTAIGTLAKDVEKASLVINKLEDESNNIGTVLDVIKGIAEQTNLLALNAAIEAARAGEQGRGFAVVADEVRTLAGRTQQSTEEIQRMIELLQAGTKKAVEVMNASVEQSTQTVSQAAAAGTSLDTITGSIASIRDMNTRIASAAEEQAVVAEDVNRNVTNIHGISQGTAESANEISMATEQIMGISSHLEGLVIQFKV